MNQLLPLQIRPPNFDSEKVMDRVQDFQMGQERLKNARMDNQLSGMKLDAATDQFGAEKDFRQRSASGDPNADEALAGYPEMQKKIWDAFDGMSPKQYKAAKTRATRMGEAARNILLFQPGSPEQLEAWNTEVGKLAEEKLIDPDMAENLISGGPNPLLIEQALSVEQWTKLHQRRREKQAEIDYKRDKDAMSDDRLRDKDAAADQRARDKEARLAKNADTDDTRMAEKADADIKRIQSQIDKNRRTGGGKAGNEDAIARDEIKGVLKDARKSLEDLEPGTPEFDDAVEKYERHRTKVFKHFGYSPDGRRLKASAPGASAKSGDRPARTATNKQTGEKVQWDYEQEKWVPLE